MLYFTIYFLNSVPAGPRLHFSGTLSKKLHQWLSHYRNKWTECYFQQCFERQPSGANRCCASPNSAEKHSCASKMRFKHSKILTLVILDVSLEDIEASYWFQQSCCVKREEEWSLLGLFISFGSETISGGQRLFLLWWKMKRWRISMWVTALHWLMLNNRGEEL